MRVTSTGTWRVLGLSCLRVSGRGAAHAVKGHPHIVNVPVCRVAAIQSAATVPGFLAHRVFPRRQVSVAVARVFVWQSIRILLCSGSPSHWPHCQVIPHQNNPGLFFQGNHGSGMNRGYGHRFTTTIYGREPVGGNPGSGVNPASLTPV